MNVICQFYMIPGTLWHAMWPKGRQQGSSSCPLNDEALAIDSKPNIQASK